MDRPEFEDKDLPLTAHLAELRTRILISLAATGVGFIISYAFIREIFDLLAAPLYAILPPEGHIIFTSYPEAFFTYLKVAFVSGAFLASPVILYQAWAFVAPGLYPHERRLALPVTIFASFAFLLGACFGYFVFLPAAAGFLAQFASKWLRLMPSMQEYVSLALRLLFAFGLAFELPVILTILGHAGLITTSHLRRFRRYAIVLAFVVSAILTPTPDAVNQLLLAGPLYFLYELSIILVRIFGQKSSPTSQEG
ncbi:twin-arginine translocase subunit TatC [Thermosulfuriphilus sp.]